MPRFVRRLSVATLSVFVSLLFVLSGCQGPSEGPEGSSGPSNGAEPVTTRTQPVAGQESSDDRSSADAASVAPEVWERLNEVVAVSDLGEVTRLDLLEISKDANIAPLLRLPDGERLPSDERLARERMARLDDDFVTTAAAWLISRFQAYEDARANADASWLEEAESQYAERRRSDIILRRLFAREIENRIPRPSDAEIEAYYEGHKTTSLIRIPFQFRMRHLIRLTYELYTVEEGDTLESIAERITNDASRADEIRLNTATRPLRREQGKEFKPLVPGEELLVPMDEQRAMQVREELEEILQMLDPSTVTSIAGVETSGTLVADDATTRTRMSFEELARRYSQAPNPGEITTWLPSGTRPIREEFIRYGAETPVGGVSEIFRTPHGWQVIQVVERQEEGGRPLEEVRQTIERQLLADARQRVTEEFSERLFNNPRLEIEYDLIAQQGDVLTTDTVIARVRDKELLWQDFSYLWNQSQRPRDRATINTIIRNVRPLQEILMFDMIHDELQDPESEYQVAYDRARRLVIGDTWITLRAIQEASEEQTTPSLRAFYETHKDELYKAPPLVTYTTIEHRLTPDQAARIFEPDFTQEEWMQMMQPVSRRLEEDLLHIQTAEEFEERAAQIHAELEGQDPPPLRADEPIPLNQVHPLVATALNDLEPGQWSVLPVMLDNSRMISVYLRSRTDGGYLSYEEIEPAVRADLRNSRIQAIVDQLTEEYLREVHFRPAATADVATAAEAPAE